MNRALALLLAFSGCDDTRAVSPSRVAPTDLAELWNGTRQLAKAARQVTYPIYCDLKLPDCLSPGPPAEPLGWTTYDDRRPYRGDKAFGQRCDNCAKHAEAAGVKTVDDPKAATAEGEDGLGTRRPRSRHERGGSR